VFTWNKPLSRPERSKQATENNQRWEEEEDGPVSEAELSLPQVAEKNTPRLMDVAGIELPYHKSSRIVHCGSQADNPDQRKIL
jgi:hypothetical protein